jgi:hypothetical protein
MFYINNLYIIYLQLFSVFFAADSRMSSALTLYLVNSAAMTRE